MNCELPILPPQMEFDDHRCNESIEVLDSILEEEFLVADDLFEFSNELDIAAQAFIQNGHSIDVDPPPLSFYDDLVLKSAEFDVFDIIAAPWKDTDHKPSLMDICDTSASGVEVHQELILSCYTDNSSSKDETRIMSRKRVLEGDYKAPGNGITAPRSNGRTPAVNSYYIGNWIGSSSSSSSSSSRSSPSSPRPRVTDSELLMDVSSTSNTFCQSEMLNMVRSSSLVNSNVIKTPTSGNIIEENTEKKKQKNNKKKKKKEEVGEGEAVEKEGGRQCTHCQSQKTPQWRVGPAGPKTLCNACGVRYMSGRLFPEYRPAKSPTFLSHRHSSSHRKVVDMRRSKGLPVFHTPSSEMPNSFTQSSFKLHPNRLHPYSIPPPQLVPTHGIKKREEGEDHQYQPNCFIHS